MKKFYLVLAAVTGMTLASCTSNDYIGDAALQKTADGSIRFGGGTTAFTRADFIGADAATKLGSKFVVYGTKHAEAEAADASNDAVVFNNFQVGYTAGTAGTTESNTADWEYVGKQAYDATPTSQGIKYWDYDAVGYTFYAFSSTDISYPAAATDKVSVTKVTEDASASPSLYNKGYAVTVKSDATLKNLYFSDRTPVAKANYDKTVNLTFRNMGSKVRVGFYETIPGYKVTIDKFYIDADAAAAVTDFGEMVDAKTDAFRAALQNVNTSVDQTLNVTYYDNTDATIENRPKVTNPSAGYNYDLKLGANVIGTDLGTSAASPTWDQTGGAYTHVFPFEANTNPMLVKVDFTLTADDGSADVIKIKEAKAVVPAQYVQWKSNFAYTYIFKISTNTNGTSGEPGVDPEGLKAITFDAIVVDVDGDLQETITTVATNSVTTYAKGAITNEYDKGNDIYVSVTNNSTGAVITPTAIGTAATEAQVYKLSKAITEADLLAKLTGSPVDVTLTTQSATIETTVPLADGTNPAISNVKFTPADAGTYAYVYTTTVYVAPTYEVQSAGTYDSSKTYYMKSDSGVYFAVPVTSEAVFTANKDKLYLQTAAGTPGVYDVKVITVK